jgi:hypothetical protein
VTRELGNERVSKQRDIAKRSRKRYSHHSSPLTKQIDDIITYHDVVTADKASLQKEMNELWRR